MNVTHPFVASTQVMQASNITETLLRNITSNWTTVVETGTVPEAIIQDPETLTKILLSNKPYEPESWKGIGIVLAACIILFLPVGCRAVLQYSWRPTHSGGSVHKTLRSDSSTYWDTFNTLPPTIAQRLIAFISRIAHPDNSIQQDIEMYGAEVSLFLAVEREASRVIAELCIACLILVPVHVAAGHRHVRTEFSTSTVQHIAPQNPVLWLHICFYYMFTWRMIHFARRCRNHLCTVWVLGVQQAMRNKEHDSSWIRTAFISGASHTMTVQSLKHRIQQAYPHLHITSITPVLGSSVSRQLFDSAASTNSRILQLENKLRTVHYGSVRKALEKCKSCRCCCRSLDISQVRLELETLKSDLYAIHNMQQALRRSEEENNAVDQSKQLLETGKAFVTFRSISECQFFIDNSSMTLCCNLPHKHNSIIVSNRDEMLHIRLIQAPEPADIVWNSLRYSIQTSWLWSMIANVVIASALVALTTPVALFVFLSRFTGDDATKILAHGYSSFVSKLREISPSLGEFLFTWLPQVFLVFVNSLLMSGIQLFCKYWEPHTTYSGRQTAVFHKAFVFLMFNTLLLPSLAYNSIGAFVSHLVGQDENPFAFLANVFVVSTGSFTICYVITETWVGGAFNLSHFGSDVSKCVSCITRKLFAKQPLQLEQHRPIGGNIGVEYATMLTLLSLCLLFSTMVPLLLPFGVVYFLVTGVIHEFQLSKVMREYQDTDQEWKLNKTCRPHVGRSAVRVLMIPVLLYQAAVIGFFTSSTCIPGKLLPSNSWYVTRAIGELSNVGHKQNLNSKSWAYINSTQTWMEVLPCVDENHHPGTVSIRGSFVQLFFLFSLFLGSTVFAVYQFLAGFRVAGLNQRAIEQITLDSEQQRLLTKKMENSADTHMLL